VSTDMERDMDLLEEEVHRRRKNDKRQKWGLFVLSMLSLVLLVVVYILANNRADMAEGVAVAEQSEKKEIAKEAHKALCSTKGGEIYDRAICEMLANAAQEPDMPLPSDPPVVIGGPSQAELVAAFREYCAAGNCKGQDGNPPTADDIAAAFMKFCADGRCTGPAGKDAPPAKDGADGAPGQDGAALPPSPDMVLAAVTTYCAAGACVGATGADGPPPTAEAVLAAVQQVCADNACDGPPGKDGAPGKDGVDGQDGAPGQSPSSITFTDQFGATHTCTPNPPGSSTYTCTSSGGGPGIPPVVPPVLP
jgi:hypothetical protein